VGTGVAMGRMRIAIVMESEEHFGERREYVEISVCVLQ